ncbi:MAG: hypothetical protein ACTS5I_03310 [Rhodanobacter sp.]
MPVVGAAMTPGDVFDTPSLSFKAVFAGWFIATGVAALLYVAGLALGFSSFNAWDAADSAKGIGIGTVIWMVLTWVTALFLGGMFASWFDGRNDDTIGAVHGLTVWGVSMVATAIWMAFGLSQAVTTHGAIASLHASPAGAETTSTAPSAPAAVLVLNAHIQRLVAIDGQRDSRLAAPITAALIAGHDDTASALLAADRGVTQADMATSLAQLAPEIQAAKRDAKVAADTAAHYAAMTLWIAFISAFLALIAAALGGWLGANHVHRVYHLRRYPGRSIAE